LLDVFGNNSLLVLVGFFFRAPQVLDVRGEDSSLIMSMQAQSLKVLGKRFVDLFECYVLSEREHCSDSHLLEPFFQWLLVLLSD
jgi:hypothetical protein